MKRRGTEEADSGNPAKVSKDSDKNGIGTLAKANTVDLSQYNAPEQSRSRQRKAPAWMSSYVTASSAKDLAKAVVAEASLKKSPSGASKKKGGANAQTNANKKTLTPKQSKVKTEGKNVINNHKEAVEKVIKSDISPSSPTSNSTAKKSTPLKSSASPVSRKVSKSKSIPVPNHNNSTSVLEVCDNPTSTTFKSAVTATESSSLSSSLNTSVDNAVVADTKDNINSLSAPLENGTSAKNGSLSSLSPPRKTETPSMLEVVICVSTSGAMQEYLTELQNSAREIVWRLQSLVPDLRIGVFAHTQGGIHDDKRPVGPGGSPSSADHNYIRTGGHSGTKWLDLGASFSQICAFVSSLEPESTVYPDYVQDNLEMALWKVQRCMSWSSCSYRTVVMLGRGRPNSPQFYLQREHWRGWIRSALELAPKMEVPVIDWRLEARMLAQMGIHVFTLQAKSETQAKPTDEEDEDEEEGTKFFKETAALTNGQHFTLTEPSTLSDVILGVCCACYGPDLLQEFRDELRDLNDGLMPANLRDIFVSLGLHSKRRSLKTIPSVVGDLHAIQSRMKANDLSNGRLFSSSEDESEEGGMSDVDDFLSRVADVKVKAEVVKGKKAKMANGFGKDTNKGEKKGVKNGRVEKKTAKNYVVKKVVKTLKKFDEDKTETIKEEYAKLAIKDNTESATKAKPKTLKDKEKQNAKPHPKQTTKATKGQTNKKTAVLAKKAAALVKRKVVNSQVKKAQVQTKVTPAKLAKSTVSKVPVKAASKTAPKKTTQSDDKSFRKETPRGRLVNGTKSNSLTAIKPRNKSENGTGKSPAAPPPKKAKAPDTKRNRAPVVAKEKAGNKKSTPWKPAVNNRAAVKKSAPTNAKTNKANDVKTASTKKAIIEKKNAKIISKKVITRKQPQNKKLAKAGLTRGSMRNRK